jgi:hypothetical protein
MRQRQRLDDHFIWYKKPGHPYLCRLHSIFSVRRSDRKSAPDSWTVSRPEGLWRFFYSLPMDQAEIDNWTTIAESMEAKGDTESWFYLRARAIADGKPDPMPNVSELMGGSAD